MAAFKLRVVTPDRVAFDGEVTFLLCRTTAGDVGIMANHTPYTAPLAIGMMKVEAAGAEPRFAAVGGGLLKVGGNTATVVTRSCEWQDEIDLPRAQRAADRARERMEGSDSKKEMDEAEIKLRLALNRISVAERK